MMTERGAHMVAATQDRMLAVAGDDAECCGTCGVIEQMRLIEDDGWGRYRDPLYGYCWEMDANVAYDHAPCERWRVR